MNKVDFYNDLSSLVGVTIDDNTILFDDLGIDGIDALEFMMHIGSKYKVDMTLYKPELYHNSEAEVANVFLSFYRIIFNRKRIVKKSFTAEHLFTVVQQKKWRDPSKP